MPWPTTSPMSQRLEFIHTVVARRVAVRTACRQFGISEKTGYKWLQRFLRGGPSALADRSHAPLVAAHQLPPAVRDAVCALREAHPTWGARKLRQVLETTQPAIEWPAASTITTLLKRAGYVVPRRRAGRDRAAWAAAPGLTPATVPNEVWAADFKGEFRLGTGPECYPLTVTDLCSRFVLGLTGLPSTASLPAQLQFVRFFEAYGLPAVMRTDNGAPFGAPRALGGLSTLAVWWIRLGIRPERIRKGRPQENGAHERMHRTLKAETTRPAAATFPAQQRRFDAWQHTFNVLRPHEALGMTPPATHYVTSTRPYPRRLPPLDYPAHVELRCVNGNGVIRWRRQLVFLSHVLSGEYVGLEETGEAEWTISLGPLRLGYYRTTDAAFTDAVAWSPRPADGTLTPTAPRTTLTSPSAPQPALPIISV
jgi:putative transposase